MNPTSNPMLEEALKYRALGLSVIPLRPRDKKPLFSWTEFQTRIASEKEIRQWWKDYPKANVGIVTGKISGIAVVDLDIGKNEKLDPSAIWDIAPTEVISRTGSGYHLIYKYPKEGLKNSAKDGIDTRGDGGYIVAPPSIHPNGKSYKWLREDFSRLGSINPELLQKIQKPELPTTISEKWVTDIISGVGHGSRNQSLAKLAGYTAAKGIPLDVAIQMLLIWNERNQPPMEEYEVKTTVESIYRTAALKATEKESSKVETAVQSFEVTSLNQYMLQYGTEKVVWMIQDWMPESTIAFLVSPPGSYKTWLILDLAISVAGGFPFLGTFPVEKPGPVLLVQQEDHHGGIAERLANIINSRCSLISDMKVSAPPNLPLYIHTERLLRFDNPVIMASFEEQIERIRPQLVIIDPLYSAATTDDYMAKTTEYMFALKRMRDEYGCSFVVVHHTKKKAEGSDREGLWGSQFLNAFLETGWQIRKTASDDTISIFRHFKVKGNMPELKITFKISTEPPYKYEVDCDAALCQTEEDLVQLLQNNGPMTATEIASQLGKHRTTIHRRLKLLEQDGVIIKEADGRYTTISDKLQF